MTGKRESKVSVIVTVFNLERYIEATLRSVLGQTYQNIEILVVDDVSTDASAEVIARFADRVRVVRMPKNGGVLLATLAGLRAATGDLVCFLDGDDVWSRDKVESVARAFERDPRTVMVSHDYRFIDGEGLPVREDDPTQDELRALARRGDHQAIDRLMHRSITEFLGNVWLGSAWSVRRSALRLAEFEEWVGQLPSPELTYQDHPLAIFLSLTSEGRFDYVDEKLLDYRLHSSNHSGGFEMTPERMMRVLVKGRATHVAARTLMERYGAPASEPMRKQNLRIAEYDFRIAAAGRQWRAAARTYVACALGLWGPAEALREGARAAAFATLGTARALRLKARMRRGRTR